MQKSKAFLTCVEHFNSPTPHLAVEIFAVLVVCGTFQLSNLLTIEKSFSLQPDHLIGCCSSELEHWPFKSSYMSAK